MAQDQDAQSRQRRTGSSERAMAPIRWPHPGGATLVLIGVWVVGMLVAVFVPALIVPPTAEAGGVGEVLLAFGCTLLGAAIMVATGFLLYRRHDEPVAWAFGVLPAAAVTIGGIIMVATKLGGA